MAAQICETCKKKGDRCYCAPNSTCEAYEREVSMTEYEILKKEETLCDSIWASKPLETTEEGYRYKPLQHMHMCDFDILYFRRCKNRKQLDKLVEQKCREYLASIGRERDEYMCCCDHCIHERYLTISEETEDLILNIATLGLDDKVKELEG